MENPEQHPPVEEIIRERLNRLEDFKESYGALGENDRKMWDELVRLAAAEPSELVINGLDQFIMYLNTIGTPATEKPSEEWPETIGNTEDE